jgi:hypothetical protein
MSKYTSKGTKFYGSIANVATLMAQVDTVNAPDAEVEDVDITALDSGVGREHGVTGYTEPGQTGGSVFFDPVDATQKAMTALLAAPSLQTGWKITWSDAAPTSWTFSGILKKFTPKAAVGAFLKADFSVQLSGLVNGW